MIHRFYLPLAIKIGVDYKLFWTLNPHKLEPFISAYNDRKKEELETMNHLNWLNGIYVSHAVATVLSQNHQYLSEPIKLFPTAEDEQRARVKESELFEAYALMFNKEFEKKINKRE